MATSEQIAQLAVQLVLQDEDFRTKLKGAEGATQGASANFEKMGKSLDKFVTRAFQGAAVAAVGFMAATSKVGSSFEYEMRKVGAITIDGMENIGALTQTARDLGATTSFTATQAAEAMVNFARAGMTSNDILMATTPALLLAESSAASMDLATASLAATMKQFSMDTMQAARVADTLSMTTRVSMFDLQGLTDAMKYGGSVGAAFGYTLEETAAALAQFRNLGLEASMAGMNFRMSMAQAAKATPKAKRALAELGLTADDINPQYVKFGDILKTVGDRGLTTAQAMTIFGRRAGANVAVLAKQMSSGTASYESDLAKIQGAQGSVMELWKEMTDTVQYQGTVSRSAFQELMLTVFDTYKDALKDMFKALTEVLGFVSNMFAMSQGAGVGFKGTIEALTKYLLNNREAIAVGFVRILDALNSLIRLSVEWIPHLGTIGRLMAAMFVATKVYALITAIQKAIITFKALSIAIGGTAISVKALAVSFGPLVIALTAAGAAMALLSSETDDATDSVNKYLDAAKKVSEHQEFQSKQNQRAVQVRLDSTKDEIVASKNVAKATGEYSEALKLENDQLMNLDASQAASMKAKGQLVEIDGRLYTIQSAILDLGIAEANDKIAQSIVDLQQEEANYKTSIELAYASIQSLIKQKNELSQADSDNSYEIQQLSNQILNNQVRMTSWKASAAETKKEYIALSQAIARATDATNRNATATGAATGGGSGHDKAKARRDAERKITEYFRKQSLDRKYINDEELGNFVKNVDKQVQEAKKAFQKRIDLAKNAKDKQKYIGLQEVAVREAISQQAVRLGQEEFKARVGGAEDEERLLAMSEREFEQYHVRRIGEVSHYFDKVEELHRIQLEQGLLDEIEYNNAIVQITQQRAQAVQGVSTEIEGMDTRRCTNLKEMFLETLSEEELATQRWMNQYNGLIAKQAEEKERVAQANLDSDIGYYGKLGFLHVKHLAQRRQLEANHQQGLVVGMEHFALMTKKANKEMRDIEVQGGKTAATQITNIKTKLLHKQVQEARKAADQIEEAELKGFNKVAPRLRKVRALNAAKEEALAEMSEQSESERYRVSMEFDKKIKSLRKEGWKQFAAAGVAAFGALAKASKAMINGLKTGLSQVGNVFNTMTGGFGAMGLDSMLDSVQSKREEEDEDGNLVNEGRSDGELIAEAMNEAFDAMIDRITMIIEALPEMITTFIQRLPEVITSFVEALPDIVQAITENLDPLIEVIVDAIPKVVRAVVEMLGELVQAFAQHFPGMIETLVAELGPLFEEVIRMIPVIVAALMAALPNIVTLILDMIETAISQLPLIVQAIIDMLPQVITALLEGIDDIVLAIFNAIPLIMDSIIMALPDLIEALITGLLNIVVTLVEEVPRLIAAIIYQIPVLVLALIRSITVIVSAVIEAIPEIITGFVEALPEVIFALIALIPALIEAVLIAVPELIAVVVMMVIDEFIVGLPALCVKIAKALARGISKAAGDFVKVFTKIFKEAFSAAKNTIKKAAKGVWSGMKKVGSTVKGWFSYSGVDYVPANMRMTVHKGEAIVPAHRNPMAGGREGGGPNPGMAGVGRPTGGGAQPPIDISVVAEGRVLDQVQVTALNRGHAPKLDEILRRTSGVKVGFDKGRYNRFG